MARRRQRTRVLVATLAAASCVAPWSARAQRPARIGAEPPRDSTCRTGPACRLALVDDGDGRYWRDPVLVRGSGAGARAVGPAWERLGAAIASDPDATAHLAVAHAARRRAHRIGAVALGAGIVVTAVAAGAVARRRGDGPAEMVRLLMLPLTLVPGVVVGGVIASGAGGHHREARSALEDAVTAWNRTVDPRVP